MRTLYHRTYLEDNSEIEIEYEQEPFIPAQTYGPPKDCYPAEGGGVYILNVSIKREDGAWVEYAATDEEIEKWAAEIETLPIEPDEPDWDYIRDMRREDNEFFEKQGWNDEY